MKRAELIAQLFGAPAALLPGWLEHTASVETLPDMTARAVRGEAFGDAGFAVVNRVALVPVFGAITAGLDFPGMAVSAAGVARATRAAAESDEVDAVIQVYNSPGGTTAGLVEAAAELRDARDVGKPIIAQVQYMAASAAYWLAAQATEIVTTPSGQAGSIGVFMMHADRSEQLKQDGVKVTLIHAGKNKVLGNPAEPLSKDALNHLQATVDEAYAEFIADVAAGRDVSEEVARGPDFGQGSVLSARAALANGLVDTIATFGQTVARFTKARNGQTRPTLATRRRTLALLQLENLK